MFFADEPILRVTAPLLRHWHREEESAESHDCNHTLQLANADTLTRRLARRAPLARNSRIETMRKLLLAATSAGLGLLVVGVGVAQQHTHHRDHQAASASDTRQLVHFPDQLREHTLANMRDHLLALQEIQEALAQKREDKAARIAEKRLGLSSLTLHGAHEVAKYMPPGMQDIGSEMHRSASRFALEAQNAGVTGDLRPALDALSKVTAQCVGCHAGYRLK